MKIFKFFIIGILLSPIFSCSGPSSYDLNIEITDSISYKKLLGKYLFIPDSFMASKLGLLMGDSIILSITADSLKKYNDGSTHSGLYKINKMILMRYPDKLKQYQDKWYFFSIKDSLHSPYFNKISFKQDSNYYSGISFKIVHSPPDTAIHILGYTDDPVFEIIKIIDFRKIE